MPQGALRTRASIRQDLEHLGVGRGSVLMLHASLRAVGPVDGGAHGLIDAVDAALGPSGTSLMVLGSRDDHAWVNERPEAERVGLLAGTPPFDASVTPADPEMGVLAEVFRRRPGTIVSDHPDGRFGARGALARSLTSDVPWDDYYGVGSTLERFIAAGGRVLRMGADMNTVTLIHYAEALVELPEKDRVRRHHLVATADGAEIRVVDTLDDEEGIVDYPGGDYFADILADYLALGQASIGTVGGARSELIDGQGLTDFAVEWMRSRFSSSPGSSDRSA